MDGAPNKEVEMVTLIRTYLTVRGNGTESDPIRRVTQYWDFDGELVAEIDPVDDCD